MTSYDNIDVYPRRSPARARRVYKFKHLTKFNICDSIDVMESVPSISTTGSFLNQTSSFENQSCGHRTKPVLDTLEKSQQLAHHCRRYLAEY